ncbi:MAG: EAL domain-containing protein [Pseudomonadota bacterium]
MTGHVKRLALASNSMDWLSGSEMGKLIRTVNWSQTPLGALAAWPQSLRTTVSLCLASTFPIALAWGPQRTQIYNDGYWPICGTKHPHSMGQDFRECWYSAWPVVGEAFEQATAGHAAFLVNQRMFLDRCGFLEETFFTYSFSPIRDETGRVLGLFHPVTELTQQSLAERRLKVLRALADHTAPAHTVDQAIALTVQTLAEYALDLPFVLIYLLDADLKQARLAGQCGLSPGAPACSLKIDLEDAGKHAWPLARAVSERQNRQVDDLAQRFGGALVGGPYPDPLQTALLMPLIPSGQEQVLGVLIAGVSTRRPLDEAYRTFYNMLGKGVTDAISNARAYALECARAEALAEIDRAKTVFFSNVSHEFRTPLTLLLGPLEEVLSVPNHLVKADRRRLELAYRNALRLLKLVNSLLDFSRIEAGRMQASYRPTDLATFTAEMASMFASVMKSAGLQFTVDCPALPEPVYVDTDLWEKIVLNLVSNAFKFTFEGRIAVRLHWQDGQDGAGARAVLTVTDTGTGIPAPELPRLFERFHRVTNARSRSYEGSGIGLALVQELVKLHGGTIGVDSTPQVGSTFTVSVPAGKAHLPADKIGAQPMLASTAIGARAYVEEVNQWLPEGAPVSAPPMPNGLAGIAAIHRPRILWADDNADMRAYVRGLLKPYWDVDAVADGQQALEAALRDPPDLVLTDVMMPNLDGFALLQALRADPRTRSMPVILLSARAGEEARVEGLQAGADDFLVKPFGARELLARISTHLGIAQQHQDAVESAQHDVLTGLPNRKLSCEFAARMLESARRGRTQVAVLYIDLDRFKPINDTYGHEVGDAVLQEVARRLKACVRGEDMAGRLGGDEFLVALAHIRGAPDAVRTAQNIGATLSQPYCVGKLSLYTSPSIGISLFPDDGQDIDILLQHADVAMYASKEQGRNNFQLYTPALNESAELVLRIENRLRSALAQGEFELHYQPIVDVARNKVLGVEALMRWPVTGFRPGDFIPVAETSGMIGPMGEWELEQACQQARVWLEHGLPPLTVSVNVSPIQYRQPTLRDRIEAALVKHSIPPGCLQLELTESALLKNIDEALLIMKSIKQLGVKFALDDFGQGYSSMSRLGRLPLDTIKVDQEFVMKLTSGDRTNAAITEAIIAIGKTLGLAVVAEGVESAEVQALLCERNCQHMQGDYLSPPLPPAEFEHWYRQRLAA